MRANHPSRQSQVKPDVITDDLRNGRLYVNGTLSHLLEKALGVDKFRMSLYRSHRPDMTGTETEVGNHISGQPRAEESLLLAMLTGDIIAMFCMVDARQEVLIVEGLQKETKMMNERYIQRLRTTSELSHIV